MDPFTPILGGFESFKNQYAILLELIYIYKTEKKICDHKHGIFSVRLNMNFEYSQRKACIDQALMDQTGVHFSNPFYKPGVNFVNNVINFLTLLTKFEQGLEKDLKPF